MFARVERVTVDDRRIPRALAECVEVEEGLYRSLFFTVKQLGILRSASSDGAVVLCYGESRKSFSTFVVLLQKNASAPGEWIVDASLKAQAMPLRVCISLLKSFSGVAWSDLARPLDQHGEFHTYPRVHDLLPCAVESKPRGISVGDRDYLSLLNILDDESMKPIRNGGVRVGPLRMAEYFGVVKSHMPTLSIENDTFWLQYKTYAEVLLVYGTAALDVLTKYIQKDGVAMPLDGCKIDGPRVKLTMALHFDLVAKSQRSQRMWQDMRDKVALELRTSAESFIRTSPSGELLDILVENALGENPSAIDVCVGGIMIACAERKRHRMANALADSRDFPSCLRLDPVSWFVSNKDSVRRQQIFTMTGLELLGHTEISNVLRSLIESVYDNAVKPAGVSESEFQLKLRERRRNVFFKPRSLYPAPKCAACPLGFDSPQACLIPDYDPAKHVTVADVIVSNAVHRKKEIEDEVELDAIMAGIIEE